jgi:hypothetical protein
MPGGLLPTEFDTDVAMGLIAGAVADSKVGENNAIPSTPFIVLSNVTSAAFPVNVPAAPMQMQVVSNAAADTGAGTGAQQVTIKYLTQSTSVFKFTEFTETITLNGVTPVNTVATNIYRINDFWVSRAGVTSFSAGNISLQSVGGATTFERIDAGTNRHRSALHWVPNGMMTHVKGLKFSVSTNGGVLFILEQTKENAAGNVVPLGIEQIEIANGSTVMPLSLPHVLMNPNNKEHAIVIVVKGRASNQSASGTFQFIDMLI